MGRVHPMDWVEVYESHTPYEWRIQEVLAFVDPWDDDRADLRAAVNTMAALPGGDCDREAVMEYLRGYLRINQPPVSVVGPEAIRMMLES